MAKLSRFFGLGRQRRPASPDVLRRLAVGLSTDHTFKVGDLVRWKEGFRNRNLPHDNEPAIVVEILPEPFFDLEASKGSPYFREPLDIVLGLVHPDGSFLTYHFDHRRFEPHRTG
jgi:hypothetical protein